MIDEKTLTEPKKVTPKHMDVFDLIIIGAGPAGLSAGLCAGRAGLKILLIEKTLPGGETSTACLIDNYLGFPGGVYGEDLSERMENHLFHYEIHYTCETVEEIENSSNKEKIIKTDLGNIYKTKAVILATGLEPQKLNLAFEKKFLGRGISYCAPCDSFLYQDKTIAVIGGGNCACYAADYLAQFASEVYLIHKSSDLKAVKSLKNRILNNPKITIMWNSLITDAFGIENVEKAKIMNTQTNQHTWIDIKGIFIYAGRVPSKKLYGLDLKTDEKGFLITDEYMRTSV
jgi:thioredoxin reductase (NADPH)